MPASYGNTKKHTRLIEFVTWPIDVRKSYLEREMPNCSDFIKSRLLSMVSL